MDINNVQETGLRTCSKCGEAKPLDDFYAASHRARGKTWIYKRPECIRCHAALNAARFQERKEAYEPARHAWYMKNYAKTSYSGAKNRAKKLGATAFLSLEEWIDLKRVTACHWCGITLHDSFTHVDHVRPLAWGGQHTRDNLVQSCANCNCKRDWDLKTKHDRERIR